MDKFTALRIMGLHDGFTEEELRKAYRTLVKKYHTDLNNSTEASEMIRKINVAHEFLKKHMNGKDNVNNNSNQQKENYRQKIIIYGINKNDIKSYPHYLTYYIELINTQVNWFLTNLQHSISNSNLDDLYKQTLNNIHVLYTKIKNTYFQENWINALDVKETTNYDVPFATLFKQLEAINKKYGQKLSCQKSLEQEVVKYQGYAGYNNIKNLIDAEMRACLNAKYIFLNIADIINNFKKKVDQLFSEYFDLLKKINYLINFITDNAQTEKIEYQELIFHINDTFTFFGITNKENRELSFDSITSMTACKIFINGYLNRIEELKRPTKIKVAKTLSAYEKNINKDLYFNKDFDINKNLNIYQYIKTRKL